MDSKLQDDLLLQAALLGRFTGDELLALVPAAPAALGRLQADGLVMAAPDQAGVWLLTDQARAAAAGRLRAAGPRAELALRTRAFRALLKRVATTSGAARSSAENHVFTQLAMLFTLLYLRLEWRTISDLLDAIAPTPPLERRHQQSLQLYRAFVAVRTGDYAVGSALLDALLAAPDLAPQLRLDATLALGQMWRNLTKYDQALQAYQDLAQLAQLFGNSVYHGVARFNLGSIANELEQYEQALELVLESKRIFELANDPERLAYACYGAGLNAMYLGRWELARDLYDQAIGLFQAQEMTVPLASCYWGKGFLSFLLDDVAASEQAYLQTVELIQAGARGEWLLAMDSWWQLGVLHFTQGAHDESLRCCDRALALARQREHEHRASVIHYFRARALQALGRDDEASAAYAAAMASVDALRGAHQQEEIKIGVLGTTQQVYEAAALHCLAQGRPAEAFAVVERACARAFLDSLAAKDPELSQAFAQPTVTLAEAQAALPAESLLLVYYTTGVLPAGEHFFHKIPPANQALLEHLLLPARVVLFAITRDSLEVHQVQLDPNALRPTAGDPRPGRHLVRERMLVALYERLVAPVEHLLVGRGSLFVVPHGPLHYVPFMALRARAGRYLVDAGGPAVALAPSATILVRNCLGRPQAPPASATLAVGCNSAGEGALRFAEAEARLVARTLGGQALTAEAARAEALLAAAGDLRALHIAGHATFLPADPLDSYLALAAGDRLSARAVMGSAHMQSELVVLSACTSGLSHVVPGDELLGLQRAWLYAGAATVVCALWEATDLVTLLVMERFYAAFAAGAAPGMALRDALVAVRALTGRELQAAFARWRAADPQLAAPELLPPLAPEQLDQPLYADPIFWAPFMLIGRP